MQSDARHVSGLDITVFFADGIQKLVYRWGKCSNLDDMLKNKTLIFKQVSLLNVFNFLVLITRIGV